MLTWVALVVVVLTLVSAVAVLVLDNFVAAVAATSVTGLGLAVLYVMLHAPDVALTEAAVGAGLSGVILALALRRLGVWYLEEGDRGAAHPLVPTARSGGQEGDHHA
jgi:energy-converting hydrogenase B subunit D